MNKRTDLVPVIYNEFKCINSDCPDTCCKDWDVVVDDDAYKYYKSVKGELGNKIMKSAVTDDDGDRIFKLENGACPFLDSNNLCEIHSCLGEEHLCDTCRNFPRICQDYTEFAEYMLSIACPEACRLVLSNDCLTDAYNFDNVTNQDNGYEKDYMNFLLKARSITIDMMSEHSISFREKLINCISFNDYVQELIDNEIFDTDELKMFTPVKNYLDTAGRHFVFEMHKKLDIMDKNWINDMYNSRNCIAEDNALLDKEYSNMALYYIFRYYLTAIDNYNTTITFKRIYCAYVICSAMTAYQDAYDNFEKRVLIFQRYSKEIEHSYENTCFLEDEFFFNKDFTSQNIIKTLYL